MKNLGNLAVLLFMLCACTSCNNDDDNTKPELAHKVAGTYNGDIELSVQEASQGTKGVEISVNRIAEDTVDVTFPAISFGSRTIPSVKSGAKVALNNNGSYSLTGTLSAKDGDINITGNFEGTVNGKTLEMNISYQLGAMPSPIKAIFSGSQSQASLTVNTSAYDTWTYVNLKTGETQTLKDFNAWEYYSNGQVVETKEATGDASLIKIDWHIAIHRYDIKTNGGAALATEETAMNAVKNIPAEGYTADEQTENEVIVDMSGMMDGKIGYVKSPLNRVLSQWLTKTPTGGMPPYEYEETNLIYLLKCADGTYAKLKFTDHQDTEGNTGRVSFTYEYPVE